ncbi:Alpha/Beta hydrolase protein [Paraphoma chrysanthemicola]|uniref:Alpha/Beta hydrolase protein n=1 Tax=Paraphoma chrysanthemicola TaxID=798071 RepID=A0A8K0QRP8_9PLEO|nr:Alpha/Beta hydrolase protein [Paraphoma chrysanthemicola]
MDILNHPINEANRGILRLQDEVRNIRSQLPNPPARADPIVLVPGFSGWGRPFLGAVNYFGGFDSLPLALSGLGYRVIVVRIGPFSSNRERACEIFTQLTHGGVNPIRSFDSPDAPPTCIPINYATDHPLLNPNALTHAETCKAVLYDPTTPLSDPLPNPWQWNATNRVNMICHSQGGTTVRYLIELLSGTSDPHLNQFLGVDRRGWIKSVVTLGTPHKGTTVTDIVPDILASTGIDALIDIVTLCSFESRPNRVYDLHLDHWGFYRQDGETFRQMRSRIARDVEEWWVGSHNGLYDDSVRGTVDLDNFAGAPSSNIYYFTMSFCATNGFPDTETVTAAEINNLLALFPGNSVLNFMGIWGNILAAGARPLQWLGFLPPLREILGWVIDVANNHLRGLGYPYQVPRPGTQIPRPDMLPFIAFPSYAMGGRDITPAVNLGISNQRFRRNDGIVNTESMDGPSDQTFIENGSFSSHYTTDGAAGVRGRYWHMGENSTIDHADQIGVFTNASTVSLSLSKTPLPLVAMCTLSRLTKLQYDEVKVMYTLFAELADRLP